MEEKNPIVSETRKPSNMSAYAVSKMFRLEIQNGFQLNISITLIPKNYR